MDGPTIAIDKIIVLDESDVSAWHVFVGKILIVLHSRARAFNVSSHQPSVDGDRERQYLIGFDESLANIRTIIDLRASSIPFSLLLLVDECESAHHIGSDQLEMSVDEKFRAQRPELRE